MPKLTKNASSQAKPGSLPPKAKREAPSSIGKALASEPPAKTDSADIGEALVRAIECGLSRQAANSSIDKALASEPPAKRGLTKFEALRCEQLDLEWEMYSQDAPDHVHVGYVDARSVGGRAIVVDVEDDFDRWAHIEDPFVDEFGDPIPNEEAYDRITLTLMLPTAKRLMQLLQEALAVLEVEKEVVDANNEMAMRRHNETLMPRPALEGSADG